MRLGEEGRRSYYTTGLKGQDVGYQNVTLWVPNIGTITSLREGFVLVLSFPLLLRELGVQPPLLFQIFRTVLAQKHCPGSPFPHKIGNFQRDSIKKCTPI